MPKAIIVCGTPGSGKTTHAKKLAATGAVTVLDIDTVTERLVRIGLVESGHSPDDRDSDYFKRTYRVPIYEALFDIARENLPYHDVVIVGPFTREIQDPDWPAKLSGVLGSPVEVHYVQCRPEIRRQRLALRGDARDRAKLEDWDRYIRYYGDEHPPVFLHRRVDGSVTEDS
ncbi:MAG: ATP-binding protein [Thiotrichales bacterium]|nr:MAG: ATP-binding protein [Thiotrichales bacterium]